MRANVLLVALACTLFGCSGDKARPAAKQDPSASPAASAPESKKPPPPRLDSELSKKLAKITLPSGFRIEVFADKIENARSMVLGDQGTLFVGSRKAGNTYALVDSDGDYRVDERIILASGLFMPNGVAFREGALYVAEVNKIWRYDDIEDRLRDAPEPTLVRGDFPRERHHGWKYIAFGPDGWLCVPVGGPCNICESEDPRFGSIMRIKPDGSSPEIFAHGVRNSVGFDWHPETGQLWFTDNGGDDLGDDMPADELNTAPQAGIHFGYPYCHQGDFPDPEHAGADTRWGKRNGRAPVCSEFEPPARKLGPHVAALGMRFYRGAMFPPKYRNRIFIPEHGSWNRTAPIGYRITMVWPNPDGGMHYEVFAEGWLQGREAWGRPVAIFELPDGSLLVSDDHAGAIYRIHYLG